MNLGGLLDGLVKWERVGWGGVGGWGTMSLAYHSQHSSPCGKCALLLEAPANKAHAQIRKHLRRHEQCRQ